MRKLLSYVKNPSLGIKFVVLLNFEHREYQYQLISNEKNRLV